MDKYQKITLGSVAISMIIFTIFMVTGAYQSTLGLILLVACATAVVAGTFWMVKREHTR